MPHHWPISSVLYSVNCSPWISVIRLKDRPLLVPMTTANYRPHELAAYRRSEASSVNSTVRWLSEIEPWQSERRRKPGQLLIATTHREEERPAFAKPGEICAKKKKKKARTTSLSISICHLFRQLKSETNNACATMNKRVIWTSLYSPQIVQQ